MSKRPTEEDLGLGPTPEEVEALSRPAPEIIEDDVPITQEDDGADPASMHHVVDKPAGRVKDPLTGKFVKADGEAAPAAPAGPAAPAPVDERKVDIRALQEARAENKVLMERMTALLEIQQRKEAKANQPPAPEIPDKTTDPLGYLDYIEGRLGKIEGETAAQARQRQEVEAEQNEVNQAVAVAKPQFDQAAAADPTLMPQFNALMESYAEEIAFLNRSNPHFQRDPRAFVGRALTQLENGHIKFAVSEGRNVAEYMRELARSRGIGAPAPTNGAAAMPAKTIAERREAQARHTSIGDLPGSAAPAQISAKDIAKMTPKQFAEFAKKMGDEGLDALFGKA